jgi:hypothetical protein
MKTFSLPSVGLFVLAVGSLFGAACGSEVEQGTTTGGSSTSSSSSTSSGSGDPALDCADACHKLETLMCNLPGGGSDCNTTCAEQVASFAPECANEVAAYFACLAQNMTTCDFPTVCDGVETALDTCQATNGCSPEGTCFGGGGMNGEMMCGCEETCKGKQYSTDCTTPAGGGTTTCDCLVSGTSVGTCTQMDSNACGVQASCCNAMYFMF